MYIYIYIYILYHFLLLYKFYLEGKICKPSEKKRKKTLGAKNCNMTVASN